MGQDRAAVLAIVPAVAVNELVFIPRELQSGRHLLIGQRPVAMLVVQVVGAVLEEDTDRLPLRLANDARIYVPAADVNEAADVAEHFAEQVRPFPGYCERTDAAGADAANRPPGGVRPQVVVLAYLGQDFLFQEPRVLVGERVVLEAAVPARLLAGFGGGYIAGVDEDANRHRH